MKLNNRVSVLLLISLTACLPLEETTSPATTSEAAPSTLVAHYPPIGVDSLQSGQSAYSFRAGSGKLVNFLLFVPSNYDPEVEWPIIVYLHGFGGSGANPQKLVNEPLPGMLNTNEDFPFIVVSPQLPKGLWPPYLGAVDQLIEHLIDLLSADAERTYLTGFSRGSYGAWQYALRFPGRFAALVPIAGGPSISSSSPPENICDLKNLPIWVFHSDADTTVPVDLDVAAVTAIESCGGDIRFTRSSDFDHMDTALDAYNNPDLYAWFLEHSN